MKLRKRINKNKLIQNNLMNKLNYDLGISVGGIIVNRFLPILSTDTMDVDNIIQVSEEDSKLWKEKENYYRKFPDGKTKEEKEQKTRLFYENRKWFQSIEEKYLPETIEVRITKIHPTNLEKFSKGIKEALWDCDFSSYWIYEGFFNEGHNHAWCSTITLTRKLGKIPEKYL